jgi:hypothetical protein
VPEILDSFVLPVRLAPDERRDLARRLGERLGTKTTGGLSILCDAVDPAGAPGVVSRLKLDGNAGEVKVRGLQQVAAAPRDGRFRIEQRDAIGIGGLENGLALLLGVEEGWDLPAAPPDPREHPAARLPATVRVDIREGGDDVCIRAREEAFRAIGERFSPLLAKGEALLLELPLGLPAAEARPWMRGRWEPPPAVPGGAAGAPFGRLALVADPQRSERKLLVREALAPAPDKADALEQAFRAGDALGVRLAARRAVAPLFVLPAAAFVNLRTIDRKIERRTLEKALAALAWDAAGTAPADPRPMPRKLSLLAPEAQTVCAHLGAARRLEGEVRDFVAGAGARTAALDLGVVDAGGARLGTIHERHLVGLPEGGLAVAAAYEKFATVAVAGPKKTAERWLDKFMRAL